MIKPPASKAVDLAEMQAFVFPQVTLNGGEGVQICGTNLGDAPATLQGVIELLDAADMTRALGKKSFSLTPHKGICVDFPALQQTDKDGSYEESSPISVIGLIAFQNSTAWSSVAGKAFMASLQVKEGNNTKLTLAPTFFPVVQIP